MKWLKKKMAEVAASVQVAASSERGDTNFISILIILGVVILLAGTFISLKDKIVSQVKDIVGTFTIS